MRKLGGLLGEITHAPHFNDLINDTQAQADGAVAILRPNLEAQAQRVNNFSALARQRMQTIQGVIAGLGPVITGIAAEKIVNDAKAREMNRLYLALQENFRQLLNGSLYEDVEKFPS